MPPHFYIEKYLVIEYDDGSSKMHMFERTPRWCVGSISSDDSDDEIDVEISKIKTRYGSRVVYQNNLWSNSIVNDQNFYMHMAIMLNPGVNPVKMYKKIECKNYT